MAAVTTPGERADDLRLFARAALARKMVMDGLLDPWDALYFAVVPTARIEEAERLVPRDTLRTRAYRSRVS